MCVEVCEIIIISNKKRELETNLTLFLTILNNLVTMTGFKPVTSWAVIIYLDDGKVLTSTEPSYIDYLDKSCISTYPLTKSDIKAIINSNVNSVRYSIETLMKIENRVGSNLEKIT